MTQVTIVVPVFDDAPSLEILLERIKQTPDELVRFLIVDNGSTDARVSELLRQDSKWNWARTECNLGFGGGILFGIAQARTNYVGWMPGNLKVDPRDVPAMLAGLALDPKIFIKASRTGRSSVARFKTLMAGALQSLILRANMLDSGGTPTVCARAFVLGLENPPVDFVFESFVLYQARKRQLEVIRPGVPYGTRSFGQSHWQRGIMSELRLLRLIYEESKTWR